ncbi:uncharacterized transposon-derived protein F54H12.3 [Trichonephila clavata]|uniref:Uncharacterized transposon-derived protein F54H12.3 n=1 Tax=Trichonephila clavata TaxID=2740835 RepID=A0A8X6FAT5_TRICU|nr:uncharacterized transposon-derived protein F54H12.3 [Trichonephila clavata]
MARRTAVIPEEFVSSYFSKTPDTGAQDIENQISRLLHESNYSDDTKAKLLSQLLLKYQHIINEPKPPLRVTIEESKEQGQELPRSNTLEDSILREIILSVPTNFQKFIQPIVEKLKTRSYAWNEYGELMKDSEIIKGTNVIDLFSYLMRNVKKGYEPYGFAVFWKGIKEIKIPTRWIGNQKLVRDLEFDVNIEEDENKIDITSLERIRISKAKKSFRRGYLPGWSDEAFKISKVYPSHPTTFELQDLKSETIKGRFYAEELQKISKRSDDYWHVEKVLKTKGRGSKKEYYVKWKGFDNRFNSWVKAAWMK